MEEVADEIAGASTELVERVLQQYGDPAQDEQDSPTDAEKEDDQNMDRRDSQNEQEEIGSARDESELDTKMDENGRTGVDYSGLTEKQLNTLRLIELDPDASQSDLAEEFEVTRATINRWLNDIPGFRWERRQGIAAEILNGSEIGEREGSERSAGLEALHERLDALERQIDQAEANHGPSSSSLGIDPELAHKVVHASMKSDLITEEEELHLLRELMG